MRPGATMVPVWSSEVSAVGASVAQGVAASVADRLVDFLRQRYGIAASPSSSANGIELRDQDGALVAIVNEQSGEIYMEAGEASRYFASVDELVASLPPPAAEKKAAAEKKICEAEHFVAEEEQTTQTPASAPEQQLCQTPQQSFADADVYRPEEQQLACMSTPSATQTDNSAKRFAEKSPASKPPPPKETPPPAKEAPSPAEEPKVAKSDEAFAPAVAETKAAETSADDPEAVVIARKAPADEAPAEVPSQPIVADATTEPVSIPSQTEAAPEMSAQLCFGGNEASPRAMAFSCESAEPASGASRQEPGGEASVAECALESAWMMAASTHPQGDIAAAASVAAGTAPAHKLRTETTREGAASADGLPHRDPLGQRADIVSDHHDRSGRGSVSGESLFDSGPARSFSLLGGGAAACGIECDPMAIAEATAFLGGLPHVLALSFTLNGVPEGETRPSRLVARADARGDSGRERHDGDEDGQQRRPPEWFNADEMPA